MNNDRWVPLANIKEADTWICGREDGTLLLATGEQVGLRMQRTVQQAIKEAQPLRAKTVSPGVEEICSSKHGVFPLEVMRENYAAVKAVYVEPVRTWFVADGSGIYVKDEPLEVIAERINEKLRQLNERDMP
jgi:hypothetical protein